VENVGWHASVWSAKILLQPRLAVLIVDCPAEAIREDVVSFGDDRERRVPGVSGLPSVIRCESLRMEAEREPPEAETERSGA
jgi:hypothetical protein